MCDTQFFIAVPMELNISSEVTLAHETGTIYISVLIDASSPTVRFRDVRVPPPQHRFYECENHHAIPISPAAAQHIPQSAGSGGQRQKPDLGLADSTPLVLIWLCSQRCKGPTTLLQLDSSDNLHHTSPLSPRRPM
jgi:hypothetical protein